MKKHNFVKTSDEYTASLLREAGLPELAKEGDKWVFLNDPDKINFSMDDVKGCQTTDVLHF